MDIAAIFQQSFVGALAKVFRPVNHADTILQTPPVWVRASGAEALLGLKRDFLNGLVAQRKVIAKKADKIVLYKYEDILNAINEMPNLSK